MITKNLNSHLLLFLIISLTFIFPIQFGESFAANDDPIMEERRSQVCDAFPPNPKQSFILSVLTFCLPGILEKYHEYREFKCEEVVCIYDSIRNNVDSAYCSSIKDYKDCKYIVGEIFSITPLAILEYWRQAIRNVLANPIGAAYSLYVTNARSVMRGDCELGNVPGFGWMCDVSSNPGLGASVFLVTVTDAGAFYEKIKEIKEGENYLNSISPDSSCDRVVEIKKELEEIVKAYEDLEFEDNS